MRNRATVTDEEIKALLDEGKSARAIVAEHRVGLARVRAIRNGNPLPTKPMDALGRRIADWCDGQDFSQTPLVDRHAAIAAEFSISMTTAAKWERAWRNDEGVPPAIDPATPKTKRGVPLKAIFADEGGAVDIPDPIRRKLAVEPEPEPDTGDRVEVDPNYLAALEAVVILTHLLNDAREGNA